MDGVLKKESAAISTLWFHAIPYYYDLYNFDDAYMSMRLMPLLKKDDLIVAPRKKSVKQFFNFCAELFDLSHDQIIFYDHLDENYFRCSIIPLLRHLIKKIGMEWTISLYAETNIGRLLKRELGIVQSNVDDELFGLKVGHKDFLRKLSGVKIPEYRYCENSSELLFAYQCLRACVPLVIKPAIGTGGKGVQLVEREEQVVNYSFDYGPVVLQECLVPDRDSAGEVLSPSVQFNGDNILGLIDQRIRSFSFKGMRYPSLISVGCREKIIKIARDLLKQIKSSGSGGFDFIIVGGEPFLIDVNIGRITGVHSIWEFVSRYDERAFCGLGICALGSIKDFWGFLNFHGIAFSVERGVGVLPFSWIENNTGLILFFAETDDAVSLFVKVVLRFFECL